MDILVILHFPYIASHLLAVHLLGQLQIDNREPKKTRWTITIQYHMQSIDESSQQQKQADDRIRPR